MPKISDLPPTHPICVIFDFDETITTKDTLELLAHATCRFNHVGHSDMGESTCPEWDYFVEEYVTDIQNFDISYKRPKHLRRTADQELLYMMERDELEDASIIRVVRSLFFQGFVRNQIRSVVAEYTKNGSFEIRKGFRELLGAVRARRDSKVGIVSINWSKEFIWDVLELSGFGEIPTMANSIDPADGSINGPDEQITPSKAFELKNERDWMTGPKQKFDAMGLLLKRGLDVEPRSKITRSPHTIVYIGDSMTDLGCWIAADIPIVIRKKGALLMELGRIQIFPVHISTYERFGPKGTGYKNYFYWANDFSEITNSQIFLSKPETQELYRGPYGPHMRECVKDDLSRQTALGNEVEEQDRQREERLRTMYGIEDKLPKNASVPDTEGLPVDSMETDNDFDHTFDRVMKLLTEITDVTKGGRSPSQTQKENLKNAQNPPENQKTSKSRNGTEHLESAFVPKGVQKMSEHRVVLRPKRRHSDGTISGFNFNNMALSKSPSDEESFEYESSEDDSCKYGAIVKSNEKESR